MKPTTIALIGAGVVLIAGGAWASFTLPVRFDTSTSTLNDTTLTMATQTNIWGDLLHVSMHYVYQVPKYPGEAAGMPVDEVIHTSPFWKGERHGRSVLRMRSGVQWLESVEWYLHGEKVTREEWERR